MAVTVARGTMSRIRANPGAILIRIENASDVAAVIDALGRARIDIANLDGGWRSAPGLERGDTNGPEYVGDVIPASTGPCLFIDGDYTPYRLLRTIPAIIASHLEAAGVTEARIVCPDVNEGPLLTAFSRRSGPPSLEVHLSLLPPPQLLPRVYPYLPRDWPMAEGQDLEARPGPCWAPACSPATRHPLSCRARRDAQRAQMAATEVDQPPHPNSTEESQP